MIEQLQGLKAVKATAEAFWRKCRKERGQQELLRLAIVTQFFPPDYAPTGQLIEELADNLGEYQIKPYIFTGQPGYAFALGNALKRELTSKQVKIRRTNTTRLWSKRIRGKTLNGILFCLRAGVQIIKHHKEIDVLLLTTAPPFLSVIGWFANLLFGIPYICLIYDLYPDVVTELGVSREDSFIVRAWHKVNHLVWSRSRQIIVLSSTMKKRLSNKHPYLSDKVKVIHNWANAEKIEPMNKRDNWFAKEHQTDRVFTVLYSGNLGRCHDAETILATVKLLQDKPIQFVFIGAGVKYQECLQQISAMGIKNCRFLPYQPKEVLPYSLTCADLGLVSIAPGLEGVIAPSKLYGIMAAGVPIAAICEPHSYLRSLVNGVGFGACFNNNDAENLADFILHLARNPKKAKNMGSFGRQYLLNNFVPQITTRQYAETIGCDRDLKINSFIGVANSRDDVENATVRSF